MIVAILGVLLGLALLIILGLSIVVRVLKVRLILLASVINVVNTAFKLSVQGKDGNETKGLFFNAVTINRNNKNIDVPIARVLLADYGDADIYQLDEDELFDKYKYVLYNFLEKQPTNKEVVDYI